MNYKRFEANFIHLESVDSTNNYAANLLKGTKLANGTAILTKRQTDGRGLRGNVWITEPDQNLICSIVVYPNLSVARVYYLNIAVSLALYKTLSQYVSSVSIKWPNDLLIGTKKVAGILIENQFRGEHIFSSVIGIGLNVNQIKFEPEIVASSMKLETGKHFLVEDVFLTVYEQLDFYINLLMDQHFTLLMKLYQDALFGLGENRTFIDCQGEFSGTIQGVDENGFLKILRDTGLKKYDLKEVRFVR